MYSSVLQCIAVCTPTLVLFEQGVRELLQSHTSQPVCTVTLVRYEQVVRELLRLSQSHTSAARRAWYPDSRVHWYTMSKQSGNSSTPVQPRAHGVRTHPRLIGVRPLKPRLAGVLLHQLARVLMNHLVEAHVGIVSKT